MMVLVFALSVLSFKHHDHPATERATALLEATPTNEQIRWLSWEDAMQLHQQDPRKVLVNIYKTQCSWCSYMDRTTYRETHLIDYINKNFYAVKLNAEQREPIEFRDRTYKYVRSDGRGYHELAATMTSGGLGTPGIVFLDESLEVIQPITGYKDPDSFEKIITYFGENQYLNTPWDIYRSSYIPMNSTQLLKGRE
ncbi:MAG: DUF255 domain-containing protein [Bacteroidota bacterium]